MIALSIGEVARRARVRPSALRYYEKVGLLAPPPRENGRRPYAKRAGFTIAEMRRLLAGFAPDVPASASWRALARDKEKEVAAAIAQASRQQTLLKAALRCRCRDLDECGSRLAAASSFGAAHG